MKKPIINQEQKLFVIPSGGGCTGLGFDVCEQRAVALLRELVALGICDAPQPALYGTLERLAQYDSLVELARRHNEKTGWRSKSELCPQLIGLEGKRVEVVYPWGKERFIVGKSGGFIPCHLAIKRRDSIGGCAVLSDSIQSVKVI